MGKHVDLSTVNRAGLVKRYAALRGISTQDADRRTRDWSRTEFREVLEACEAEERLYAPRRLRTIPSRITSITGYTTMNDGIAR